MERRIQTPQLTVVSGPMGGGKSGVNRAVIEGLREADTQTWGADNPRLMSVSLTSRSQREGEPPEAYRFDTPPEDFSTGAVMESVCHSGNYYGSPTPPPRRPRHLEIEVTGLKQILESQKPEVIAARAGMRAVYLLQSSMQDLWEQISGRQDGVPEEVKLNRIARYPAEINYILEHNLPYAFIKNVQGDPALAQQQTVQYMLGEAVFGGLQTEYQATYAAVEALVWLRFEGIEPQQIQ